MTVWLFDNEDCTGIFSSKEKAFDSLYAGAERCEWRNVKVIENGPECFTIEYQYENKYNEWVKDSCYIVAYELDEDNFSGFIKKF